jgi:hypothetical protein
VHSVRSKCTPCTRCTWCAASVLGALQCTRCAAMYSLHSVRCRCTWCTRCTRCTRCAHCAQSLIAAAMENWLANFGYGNLLPQVHRRTAGLFGTLLVTPEAIRFLALPEILMLVGALVPCWLPAEHRAAVRMLGNGISTRNLQWNCFSSGSDAS